MTTAELTARFDAPAARVWDLVRWEAMEEYVAAGFFRAVEYDERRAIPGATRRLFLHGAAAPVRERLETIDAAACHYVYRLLESGPMPVADYVGELRITPLGDEACELHVRSTCRPVGVGEDEWRRIYLEMQQALFGHIASRIATETARRESGTLGPR